MVKQGIQIYARVKPTKAKTGTYEIVEDDSGSSVIEYTIPKELSDGYINNKREVYKFRFNKVFDQKCSQDEVFESVAQGVADNVLSGYNGTIFAYGQTGSGKTFTITGGAEKYQDRGLIPRTLSYIFDYFEKHPDNVYTVHISYLEIYNEKGYDLLDPKHEASKLEDLPKVSLLEDADNNIHLKNLSLHQANNEEEALNCLFLGDTNRMIAETPMNQASTRSHCIFTIHVSTRESGKATIRRAKLHLVDLAGSERIAKTGVAGIQLAEAKYINVSLHFLEQVIVALSEKSRSHIPYRNSMMTSVLRDSLGGNCMTTMIATCSVEKKNIDESISTCRFAQRVAMIKNDVLLNEEIDPKLMIAQLKREIQQLKAELAMATGQEYTGQLDDNEYDRLRRLVNSFIEDPDPDAALSVGADMRKIDFCFKLLKEHVLERPTKSSTPSQRSQSQPNEDSSYLGHQTETSKLKELIKQRDNEISILCKAMEERLDCEAQRLRARSDLQHAARNGLWDALCFSGDKLDAILDINTRGNNRYLNVAQSAMLQQIDNATLTTLAQLEKTIPESVITLENPDDCDDESIFVRRMDTEALLILDKLAVGVEGFTLQELRRFHRKARVAVEAGITNNAHIHTQITSLLDKHIKRESHSVAIGQHVWRDACGRFVRALRRHSIAHAHVIDLEKQKLDAEREYVTSLRELSAAEWEKREALELVEAAESAWRRRRTRTTSI
ncbi:kinesin-like protein KIF6 isoform X2 [Nematostella vectensis]|uniref:kinesin-like protein KIF6 isoform X2 n=1 Tax=Nematostella vectensis TaxID=45351 RepID=UPI0020778A41|nr:kinesin-like protein KIF6 isoform X2 [Nematostella vectensis]